MTSRADHRRALMLDTDVLHSGLVAATACLLSAGLLYLYYLRRVIRTAKYASIEPKNSQCLLLFGKHAPAGRIDRDFQARIDRASALIANQRPHTLILLGGGPSGVLTEAQVAQLALTANQALPPGLQVHLESHSRDTLQNLRNARELLREIGHDRSIITLISSRYHLDRCQMFARQLGLNAQCCAAEPALQRNLALMLRLCGEAAYVCWVEVGMRWARLIGHQRMLARVT